LWIYLKVFETTEKGRLKIFTMMRSLAEWV